MVTEVCLKIMHSQFFLMKSEVMEKIKGKPMAFL